MKKHLTSRFLLLAFTIFGILLPSCSSDDNDVTENSNLLIGTWRYDWGDDPLYNYTAYSFFDNGTGIYFDKGNAAESFLYTYDTQRQEITIIEHEYYSYPLIVKSLKPDVLEIYDDYDDEIEVYRRTELTYDMLILGEWYLHVDPLNYHERGTMVTFYAGGSYEAIDKDSFSEVNGTWSIKNNIISISGPSQIAGRYIIDTLVINGIRLIRADHPDESPYLVGGWNNRGDIYQ